MLQTIIKQVAINLEERKRTLPLFTGLKPSQFDFKKAIQGKQKISLIAEVKKKSPSAGLLNPTFNHLKLAEQYQKAGASCLSVLTEESFFEGSHQYLAEIRKVIDLPLLCKDFILEEYQIEEARHFGADAILLIAAIHSPNKLRTLIKSAKLLNMSVLLEVHTQEELSIAMQLYKDNVVIGINNRNLQDLSIDLSNTTSLSSRIPKDYVIVGESGYKSTADISSVLGLVDAVLVGSSLVSGSNPEEFVKNLLTVNLA